MKLKIYTRKWNRYQTIILEKTLQGWKFKFVDRGSEWETQSSIDYKNLKRELLAEGITFPNTMEFTLEEIWRDSREETVLQKKLDILGEFISNCEINDPFHVYDRTKYNE